MTQEAVYFLNQIHIRFNSLTGKAENSVYSNNVGKRFFLKFVLTFCFILVQNLFNKVNLFDDKNDSVDGPLRKSFSYWI